jgi:hypothetical protein
MKSIAGKFVLIIIIVGVAIQFIPVGRSNPPVEEEILTPPQVKTILKRACYDCHSHETKWPWYSQVAPASWPTWNRYSPEKRKKFIKEIWEEVEEGEMPPWFYLPLHPEASLSAQDHRMLQDWTKSVSLPKENEDDD